MDKLKGLYKGKSSFSINISFSKRLKTTMNSGDVTLSIENFLLTPRKLGNEYNNFFVI